MKVDATERQARRLFSQYRTWQREQSQSPGSVDYVGYMLNEHAKRIGPEVLPVLIRLVDILWESQDGNLGHVVGAIDTMDAEHGTQCYMELLLHDGTSQVAREVAISEMVMSRRGKEMFEQLGKVGPDQTRVLRAASARREILVYMLRCLDCHMPMGEWRWAKKAFAELEQPLVPASEEDWNEVGYSLYSSSPYPLWVRFLPPLAPLVSVSNGAGSIAT
ncbi:MAG: hypothetical protein ACYTKD_18545, partial [Planctomycetota bacterium]